MGSSQSKFDYGTYETLVLEKGKESTECSKLKSCKLYHNNYYKVKEITGDMLPDEYRSTEIVDLIQEMASLTVKIVVKYCSLLRPKYWTNKRSKNEKYVGYAERGCTVEFCGSGRISDVFKDDSKGISCTCSDCRYTTSRKRESWIIWVFTATHVVYETSEAENAVCYVFYDNDDGTYKTFRLIKKMWSNVSGDLCLLAGATCDRDLAHKLTSCIDKFNNHWKTITDQYSNRKKGQYDDRLVVIVSHPHGWTKKISFSFLEEQVKKDIENDTGWLFTYKACTCVGSSGAPVYIYGQDWFKDEIVHSGYNNNVNYSTTWCPAK